MAAIFRVNEHDLAWATYEGAPIRFKALTLHQPDVPSMQYIEYAPGHADPVHSHDTDEVLVVIEGELLLDDVDQGSGPGSVVFIPRDTEYSVRGGKEGVRFFRVVVGAPV